MQIFARLFETDIIYPSIVTMSVKITFINCSVIFKTKDDFVLMENT